MRLRDRNPRAEAVTVSPDVEEKEEEPVPLAGFSEYKERTYNALQPGSEEIDHDKVKKSGIHKDILVDEVSDVCGKPSTEEWSSDDAVSDTDEKSDAMEVPSGAEEPDTYQTPSVTECSISDGVPNANENLGANKVSGRAQTSGPDEELDTIEYSTDETESDADKLSERANVEPYRNEISGVGKELGTAEQRQESQGGDRVMTETLWILSDLLDRTLGYLALYSSFVSEAIRQAWPLARIVVAQTLAPFALSLAILFILFTVFLNVWVALKIGTVLYAKSIVCDTPIYVPLTSHFCSTNNTQSMPSNITMPDFTKPYSSYEELAERNFVSWGHTTMLLEIGRKVRQLQYELNASNLEVTIKSNLDSKITQHIKLNDEARRVTQGFRNKISLTVSDVLVQTNFSLKALEGFQQKRNALEERHEASKLQMYIMKFTSWVIDHHMFMVRIPPGTQPWSITPSLIELDLRAAQSFQADLRRICDFLRSNIINAVQASQKYDLLSKLTDEVVQDLTRADGVVIREKARIVESHGLIASLQNQLGINVKDTDGIDFQQFLIRDMSRQYRDLAEFYGVNRNYLETILDQYNDWDSYVEGQKEMVAHAEAGQNVSVSNPINLIRDLQIAVTQMEAKAKKLQEISKEWEDEQQRYSDYVFGFHHERGERERERSESSVGRIQIRQEL